MNVLLIYRSGIAYDEFNETYIKYKSYKYNIYAILENEMVKNYMEYLYKDITFLLKEDLLEDKINMKFDYIIGNPPYQDGTKQHGQNKIYNIISKKCLNLMHNSSEINFITPIAVLRPSKRFSILNKKGLEIVDFTINEKFNVGVTVVNWKITNGYEGKVKVINSKGITYQNNSEIYNDEIISKDFVELYFKIRKLTKNISARMFNRNNLGNNFKNKKTKEYKFKIYNRDKKNVIFSNKEPFFFKKQKCIFRLSGSLKSKFSLETDDFDQNFVVTECSEQELKNINSFIETPYFQDIINKWKLYTDSKSYDMFTYLPKFDKTKHWTNNDVKEFFEGLI